MGLRVEGCVQVSKCIYLTLTLTLSSDALQILSVADQYTVNEDGILQRITIGRRRGQVIAQWVVPQSLRPLLLKLAHDDISAAHAGVQGTTTRYGKSIIG